MKEKTRQNGMDDNEVLYIRCEMTPTSVGGE